MKKIIFRGVIVIIALSIGGKILMDRREKDNEDDYTNNLPDRFGWYAVLHCLFLFYPSIFSLLYSVRWWRWLLWKREKDNEELRTIQTDLANYLYNHYEIYTKDKDKIDEADKKYNGGNGTITDDEYLEL